MGATAASRGCAGTTPKKLSLIMAEQKYQRCMVMAGGGFRFGIYLGMYAAARDCGRTPDLLLASCGGAIAAAAIQALPDDRQRKAWLSSPEMYQYWCGLKSSSQAGIARALFNAARRKLSRARAPTIPDLFADYLFETPPPMPAPQASLSKSPVSVAIIGAKLLFGPTEVGRERAGRKLFAETVFCDARTADLLRGMPSPFIHPQWGEHTISAQLLTDVVMPLREAVRVSIADSFYFPCHDVGGQRYTGGMVDLFPIEIAKRLAHETMIEFKSGFDQTFAIPAWRAVLGLDGNQRLKHVHGQTAETWVDTSDVSRVLARQQIQKQLDWRRNQIRLRAPADHDTYVRHIEAQWTYGYARGIEACQSASPLNKSTMRHVTQYNRAQSCAF